MMFCFGDKVKYIATAANDGSIVYVHRTVVGVTSYVNNDNQSRIIHCAGCTMPLLPPSAANFFKTLF